jgi:hypothetical protein
LCGEELKPQLVELRLDLGGLNNVFDLWVFVVLNADLLVTLAGNRDAYLELASDLAEVF